MDHTRAAAVDALTTNLVATACAQLHPDDNNLRATVDHTTATYRQLLAELAADRADHVDPKFTDDLNAIAGTPYIDGTTVDGLRRQINTELAAKLIHTELTAAAAARLAARIAADIHADRGTLTA